MAKIAVLGANEPSIPFYRQAKALGYSIIGIAWAEGAVCKEYCDKFYPVSFAEKEKVLEICKTEHVDGITSFSLESALPTVVYVAKAMGLVGNDELCLKLTENKYTQRQAFEQNGLPVPKYKIYDNKNCLYKQPRLFQNDDNVNKEKIEKNHINGWSFDANVE